MNNRVRNQNSESRVSDFATEAERDVFGFLESVLLIFIPNVEILVSA